GIRKIELQREQNAKEQNAALARLEEQKKPILQRQTEAKAAADLCDRELAGVERRLQENDAADRELLKKLAELQAQLPPPDDIETQMASIGAQRVRLPEQKADVHKHRAAVERHSQHTAELAVLSSQIDKQELRKFYFAVLSVVVLLAIVLVVVFQSPQKREWLPQETDTILSVNLEQLEREDL